MPGRRSIAILEQILEHALKSSEEAEVFHVSTRETPAIFEANKLKLLQTRETEGVALRIIKDGRIGFAATTNLSDPQRLIDAALEVAPFGAEAKLEFPSGSDYPSVDVYDPALETYPVDDMVQTGQTLIDALRSEYPDVQCEGRVGKTLGTQTVLNSRGGRVTYTAGSYGVYLHGTLIQGEDMLFVGDGESSCSPIKDTLFVLSSVKEQLENARRVVAAPSGSLPVIFTPHGVAGTLIGPLLSGFSGRTVLQGASPLVGRLGERIVSDSFSIWDDPTLPFVPGSSPSDDEGVPSRRKALIEQGVASTFLYDLQTAGRAGETSTGNGSRGLTTLPSPSSTVLVIEEGNTTYADMIKDVKDGIVVEQLLGAGQGNVLAGEFNANVLLGYRIENGEISGRVKDTMISGNVYDVLNSLAAIGSESRWLGGRFKTPPIYCRSVSISAKD